MAVTPANFFREFWSEWRAEQAAALRELMKDLREVWGSVLRFRFFWQLLTSGGNALLPPIFQTINAVQEWREDSALALPRALSAVSVKLIPVPHGWDQRVMKAGDALRWAIELFIESSIDVVDLDLPAEIDAVLLAAKLPAGQEAVRSIQALDTARGLAAARTISRGMWITVVRTAGTFIGATAVILCAARFLIRMHGEEGERVLRRFALSQDNPRRFEEVRAYRRKKEDE